MVRYKVKHKNEEKHYLFWDAVFTWKPDGVPAKADKHHNL